MLKLSTSAYTAIFLVALFGISIAATTYYYYSTPNPTNLRILYTHADAMVNEIVRNFEKWYQQQPKYGRSIKVTATHTDPQTAFEKATAIFRTAEAEIWWGGPVSLFEEAHNRLLPYNSTQKENINLTYFCPLMDPTDNTPHWYATSLYGLGVMYNEHGLNELGLPKPQTWTDLIHYQYEGNITMVDPTQSELTSPFITLILDNKNWTSGWEYLVTLSALIEEYDTNERDSTLKVSSNYLPLAIAPDFYGYERMAMNISEIGFAYLDGTILRPDPIAIINRGTYINEAKAFVDYILTKQAQDIIGKYLIPMHENATNFPSEFSPFDPDFPPIYSYNETLKEIIGDYYETWITEKHTQIKNAWSEIREANVSSPFYKLAMSNFTYAAYYINSNEIDTIFIETDNWTNEVEVTLYLNEWRDASSRAYAKAIENAEKAK